MSSHDPWQDANTPATSDFCEQADRHPCLLSPLDVGARGGRLGGRAESHVPPRGRPAQASDPRFAAAEHVLAIVWWSKNYAVYERFHQAFARYPAQFFHFTINPRREDLAWIEPDVPPLDEAVRQMRHLASLPGGPQMVAWRYDPIMFWSNWATERSSWDPAFFERMCREMSALGVTRCITSLADRYSKFEQRVRRNFPNISLRDPSPQEIDSLAADMAEIAGAFGMLLLSCTEAGLACQTGFAKGACIDGRLFQGPIRPATDQKMRGREECGCTVHTDIGDYVTQECGYSCVYCYANPNHRRFVAKSGGLRITEGRSE